MVLWELLLPLVPQSEPERQDRAEMGTLDVSILIQAWESPQPSRATLWKPQSRRKLCSQKLKRSLRGKNGKRGYLRFSNGNY